MEESKTDMEAAVYPVCHYMPVSFSREKWILHALCVLYPRGLPEPTSDNKQCFSAKKSQWVTHTCEELHRISSGGTITPIRFCLLELLQGVSAPLIDHKAIFLMQVFPYIRGNTSILLDCRSGHMGPDFLSC